jgi:hypothetical protein
MAGERKLGEELGVSPAPVVGILGTRSVAERAEGGLLPAAGGDSSEGDWPRDRERRGSSGGWCESEGETVVLVAGAGGLVHLSVLPCGVALAVRVTCSSGWRSGVMSRRGRTDSAGLNGV